MIIILTQCFPPRVGGIENLIENLSLELSKVSEVLVLADQYDKYKDNLYDNNINNRIKIKRFSGIKFLRKRKKILELKKNLELKKVICIIGDSWKSFELSVDILNYKSIPSICLAHGNEIIPKNIFHKKRLITTMNKVSQIVCNSNYTSELVKKTGITNQYITCIHPGAKNNINIPERAIPKFNGSPIITTLARLEKRKGHSFILSAIEKLKNLYPNILYVIAGSGEELSNLKKLVSKLDIRDNVLFVGNINNNEKNFLFKKTDLMVMPTTDESGNRSIEGFGIAYIEAAFYGIPSIASNIGGTSEAVLHNETGLILSNIDDLFLTLQNLLSDNNKIKKLGQNAKIRAEKHFLWSNVIKKYLHIINNIDKKN